MEDSEDVFFPAEMIVHDIVEELVVKGAESLYDRYLEGKSAGFSVRALINTIFSTAELFHFRKEPGEPLVWLDDPEPDPSGIDTWTRHSIPVKTVIPFGKVPEQMATLPDAKSVASHSTRRTNQQRIGGATRRGNFKESNTIDEPIQPSPIEPSIQELDEEIESLRHQKERLTKRKKEETERLKSIKAEEEAKEKKIQKDSETMKNKTFTYDFKGKIILITPSKPETFPHLNQTVRYSLPGPIPEEPKPANKAKPSRFLPVKRNKTAPKSEQDWVKNLTVGQQAMFDQIKLSPRVALIDGPRSKQGVDEGQELRTMTMTRKEYQLVSKAVKSAGQQPAPERRSSVCTSVDSDLKNFEGKPGFFESIPDFEGLGQEAFHPSSSMSPVRTNKTYGKVVRFGNSFEVSDQSGPTDRFNADILKNKNWGMNPASKEPKIVDRLPKKASTKEIRELYGDMVKKPKDQPFMTNKELWDVQGPLLKKPRDRPHIERIEKKTRMPPPPYGFTMINALPEISGLANSLVSNRSVNEGKR